MTRRPGRSRPAVLRAASVCVALLPLACAGGDAPDTEERAAQLLLARAQGMAYLQQDRLDEAAAEFRRLAELAPEESAGPANLALVAIRAGDVEEAERLARTAVDRAPDDPDLRVVLAKALEEGGDAEAARAQLERALELDPDHQRALWVLATEAAGLESPARVERLERLASLAPSNLPVRMELVGALLEGGRADEAVSHMDDVGALFSLEEGRDAFDEALSAARADEASEATAAWARLHDLLRTDPRYRADVESLRGPLGAAPGFATLSFSHELSLTVPDESAVLAALRFADASSFAGLDSLVSAPGAGDAVVAVGDIDGDGDEDLYVGFEGSAPGRLLRNDLGRFVDVSPDALAGVRDVRAARFADVDGDGARDLFVAAGAGGRLFLNEGDGTLRAAPGFDGAGATRAASFLDLDHDGDLDLLVARDDGIRVGRGDGSGGFADVPGALGMAGAEGVVDLSFADVDDDADVDVVAVGRRGVEIFANQRQDRFTPVAVDASPATAVAVGDYDNDGHPDLAVAGEGVALHRNLGEGRFERDTAQPGVSGPVSDVAFADVDNDGRLDLLAATGDGGAGGRVRLFRNTGAGFEDRSDLLPGTAAQARGLAVFDYNEDGDLDVVVALRGGAALLRNDGGNGNHHVDLRLVGRGLGSGKVNRAAVGSKVEVRAGDLYQSATVRDGSLHFGLGNRLKADVIRIVWTNGVPQYLYFPGTDAELIESQELKGSCAFLYAWNGTEYAFVTDAMWRSALGMPLGIMGRGAGGASARRYAPPTASREYLRIDGDALRPRDGVYRLQITEELWEVAYVDEVDLVAVDHPESVELFVDEKFVPPLDPRLQLFAVRERLRPARAVDGRGRDVLPALRDRDAVYVSDLRAGAYQGIVEPHVVELTAPDGLPGEAYLFLQGWIFPSDASINVAVSQSGAAVVSPRLEVPDGSGGWRTAIEDIGFPSGKDKTVVVDVSGLIDDADPRVRIRTNMQVYWDHAFFARGDVAGPVFAGAADALTRNEGLGAREEVRASVLHPQAADLHRRGFSREYRRGRYGPHWFDYQDVSQASRWLPIEGLYTRYGAVDELVQAPDDMYVVMAPGDEMTLEFEALDEPPPGWTRTFFLYSDGWIKDADLNTATGNTVAPMPYHAQPAYPHEGGYPTSEAHRAYLERYQTREVSGSTLELRERGGS